MSRFGLVIITAVATAAITASLLIGGYALYLASDDEVLVITQSYNPHPEDSSIQAIWMSKGYLENRNQASRYNIPTKRVLVMFDK